MFNNDLKWKITSLVLIIVTVFGGLFSAVSIKNIKLENTKLDSEVTKLEEKNSKLSENINSLNAKLQTTNTEGSVEETNKKINDVANKFIELYPSYDIKTIGDKKKELEKIATQSIADSIVPEDMIASSKKTLDSSDTKKGEAYSSDPTFKSRYANSTVYMNVVNADEIKYFAEVNYKTESSSGDTENTVYINFIVTNKDGKVLVTDYNIKYLN